MSKTQIFDVIHIHNPVTFTVAKLMFAQGHIKNTPIMICSRGTQWDGPHLSLPHLHALHDQPLCQFLAAFCDQLPADGNFRLNLYLPHIAHQFGRIMMMSGKVDGLYYLEEGVAAYEYDFMQHPTYFQKTHVLQLMQWLSEYGVTDRLQLDEEALGNFNQFNPPLYCGTLPQYKASYALTSKALSLLPNVCVLDTNALNDFPPIRNTWLVMLNALTSTFDLHGKNAIEREKYIYSFLKVLETQSAFTRFMGCELVFKLHPDDELTIDPKLRHAIEKLATPYHQYLEQHHIPEGYEPAFYNFTGYFIIGESSALLYMKLFGKEDRLIHTP